jgi:hypothetical protein
MNPTLSYLLAVERCRELRGAAARVRRSQPPIERDAEAAVQPSSGAADRAAEDLSQAHNVERS